MYMYMYIDWPFSSKGSESFMLLKVDKICPAILFARHLHVSGSALGFASRAGSGMVAL